MSRRTLLLSYVFAVALHLPVESAAGQSRDLLVQGILHYQQANFQIAIPLLSRGLDTTAGPRDEMWSFGLHALAEALIASGERDLAVAWLFWAFQVEPEFEPDSLNFAPDVVEAMRQARERVRRLPQLPPGWTVTTQWRTWGVPRIGERDGFLVVEDQSAEGLPLAVQVDATDVELGAEARVPSGVHVVSARKPVEGDSVRLSVAVFPTLTVVLTLSDPTSATATLTAFLEAVRSEDWESAARLRSGAVPMERWGWIAHDSSEIGELEIAEDHSSVVFHTRLHYGNCEALVPFVLVRREGWWFVQSADLDRAVDLSQPPLRHPAFGEPARCHEGG